ncbi:MAG: hypothetical protein Q7S09_01820 [bacterium]|nr:hypothetical protein [bacterium]
MEVEHKKLRIGWFSFSCCEDSTIMFTELLNDHFEEWLPLLDIRHARVLQSKNILDELDVAFIEGAISSDEQARRVQEIREKSKKVVAIGSCAVMGLPAAQRNFFNPQLTAEISPILTKFNYRQKAARLDEIISVDHKIPGCPMNNDVFLTTLAGLLKEFGIVP